VNKPCTYVLCAILAAVALCAYVNTLAPEAAVAGASGAAPASVFTENFESYAAGTALHGKGGWKGWNNNATVTAMGSAKFASSGSQSVEVLGTCDCVHELRQAGGQWALSAMQYIPSGGTGISLFILLNRYQDGGTNTYDDWSIETQYDLRTGAITCWHGALPGAATILFDRWVPIKLLINLDQNTFEEFYNGRRIAAGPWDDDAHASLQAIDLFGNGASSVYYDDIRLDAYHAYQARNALPADGAIGVIVPLLRWTAGDGALFHDVYLAKTPELTAANKVASRLSYPLYYHLEGLAPGVTYYWRIDEIEPTDATHTGNVWTFTTKKEGVAPVSSAGEH
jgi:hypothetical protein